MEAGHVHGSDFSETDVMLALARDPLSQLCIRRHLAALQKQEPDLFVPGSCNFTDSRHRARANSEGELEDDLALPWRNSLARLAHQNIIAIDRNRSGIYKAKAGSVINIVVRSTNSHAIKDIGVLHSQFTSQMFAKIEVLGQRHNLVCEEWVA